MTATAVLLPSSPAVPLTTVTGPVVAAAGDIACDPQDANYNGGAGTSSRCHMRAVSDVLVDLDPDAVLPLGDAQYDKGTLAAFQASYAPTWGRVDAVAHPVPGNHEYRTKKAAGYFGYFQAAGGPSPTAYRSFDLGGWHVVALNSNCVKVGGCGAGSPQEQWLRADLAAHPAECTLAYWHHARFSSGGNGDDSTVAPLFRALYDAGADVVLVAHSHHYERFAPLDPSGTPDSDRGVRQFVVGTGGKSLEKFVTVRVGSEARSKTFGALKLTLGDGAYDWEFLPEAGKTFRDSGSGTCH
jgi:hypothetical protein